MSRPLRLEFPGAYYHVMNRGSDRQAIFQDDVDRNLFLKLLEDVHTRWDLQIYGYSLMRNHYHLCVQTPTTVLSRVMRHINGVYTQKFNQRHERDGPLFRGRYKAILIEKDPYLLTVIRYMHQNPMKGAEKGENVNFRWGSSYYYLTAREGPSWLDLDTILDHFGGDRNKLIRFISEEKLLYRIGEFYRPEQQGPVLGSEEFREKVRTQEDFKVKDHDIPERRYLAISIKRCIRAVGSAYGTDEEKIKNSRRGERNEARQVAMYICREAGGYRHREIAEAFRAGSYSTSSSACALLKKRMRIEAGLRKKVTMIIEKVTGR
jgi:putative transposase